MKPEYYGDQGTLFATIVLIVFLFWIAILDRILP